MKPFFGYIRVSTAKQGQQGVSLQEQQDSILRYASRNGLEIVSWFEERETAAKRGRPVFTNMMRLLRQGKARGIVLHKIDRGARNLKDWSDIADLIDAGIEVHFANESLDMQSRGGRLSADIQAVVAADFIRNLREETRKGFYGRLKQGLYPLAAPVGYLDRGKGNRKEPDPLKAPLIRKAFELYASNRYNLPTLVTELHQLGLRNKRGGRVSISGLSRILNNVFYLGLIHIKRVNQTFSGKHEPLIGKSLFDRVQRILTGKTNTRLQKHDFLFRRLFRCDYCGYTLIGERQKGHHYYRCHTKNCPKSCVREESVEAEVERQLASLSFSDEERSYFRVKMEELNTVSAEREQIEEKGFKLRMDQLSERQNRLVDAYLDGALDRATFEQRKTAILLDQKDMEEKLNLVASSRRPARDRLSEFLELAGVALLSYRQGNPEEKRELLQILTSNRLVRGKDVVVKLSLPFAEVAKRYQNTCGDPKRAIPRTWNHLLSVLSQFNEEHLLPTLKSFPRLV